MLCIVFLDTCRIGIWQALREDVSNKIGIVFKSISVTLTSLLVGLCIVVYFGTTEMDIDDAAVLI